MVYRIYVEKKKQFSHEAKSLKNELELAGITGIEDIRVINRYDVENVSEELFNSVVNTVFSEPQVDNAFKVLETEDLVFGVEPLPGQFDQRADSAAQCIQIISQLEKPIVKSAKIYVIKGDCDVEKIKKFVINPVECRECDLSLPKTLKIDYDIPSEVKSIEGFLTATDEELKNIIKTLGLAMDFDDIKVCQNYFKTENREPTMTEIRMIDTYWSDHCRHTTFLTTIDSVKTEDETLQKAFDEYVNTRKELGRTKPINLMDIATLGARYLKAKGILTKLDESDEINACTVKIKITVDGKEEDWLLLFKNETHNHPTEIEPFGGAATCIGGAIRDPLSGRAYVYSAMRVTGAGNPLTPVNETIKGKLPQRKIVQTAAAGYSSYGNQIGLATGIVDELYHDGYVAKRMEIGAVVGATPQEFVRRECPTDGDVVILLGGRTGRDGCGGATGSSKSHSVSSIETCGAEVQKGNAPEERKLQRLFRNGEAVKLIKRCNDFGAGGVSVAIGELADGLKINLNAVPKKYDGLDGTELAISESQERMAVVVEAKDADKFIALADKENLEATIVARVTKEARLVMEWNGKIICDISREFLNSNGAEKHIDIEMANPQAFSKDIPTDFASGIKALVSDLNVCSKRGLGERFDSTIGAGTVLMPFGGKYQKTPIQAMVNKISQAEKDTEDCSLMAWGYNPFISEKSPYHGAYLAVCDSVSKLIATGAEFTDVYLTFQEYFEKPLRDSKRWGKPLSALLGAFKAQKELGIGAIGGKDSMSGSFEDINVPPTLVSFAVTIEKIKNIVSNDFKKSSNSAIIVKPEYDKDGLPVAKSLIENFKLVTDLMRKGVVKSAYAVGFGGIAEAVYKMSIGNGFGFKFNDLTLDELFGYNYGSFVLEVENYSEGVVIGTVTDENYIEYQGEKISLDELNALYEGKLESVYPCNEIGEKKPESVVSCAEHSTLKPRYRCAKPRVLIPVFPGTNCEYDSAKAVAKAGAEPIVYVINNKTSESITKSCVEFSELIKTSQAIFIPGGFSGGDEPDGSGKFITAFFRNKLVKDAVTDLLDNRDGLMLGICNGFQALIKLGLVPYGKIVDTDENSATLSFNTISRHQSKIVNTRVASVKSPWLSKLSVGDVISVPISHGEGRFIANDELLKELVKNGQVITQYCDLNGNPTTDIQYNPNGSYLAIEGIVSPDGRVLGKMGHSERVGTGLYKNVVGNYDMGLFESLVAYFK